METEASNSNNLLLSFRIHYTHTHTHTFQGQLIALCLVIRNATSYWRFMIFSKSMLNNTGDNGHVVSKNSPAFPFGATGLVDTK